MATVAREALTDGRLDDLKASVDAGFRDNREEFRALRVEIQGVREEVAALGHTFQQLTWGLIGAMLLGFLGTISAIVTQL